MTEQEFVNAFRAAGENEMVCSNIAKKYSPEEGGYFYAANCGECDGGDSLAYWFESVADEKGYVSELDARI